MRARNPLAALVVILAVALSAPAAAHARLPADFWGIDSVNDPSGQEFSLMHQTGVQIFRMPMSWRQIEPQAPTSAAGHEIHTYDWSVPDQLVARAAATGVDVQATLIDTPAWLSSDARNTPLRSDLGTRSWRAFAAAVVARYGRGGTFWAEHPQLPVDPPVGYQIWNEMNTIQRYRPRPDPAEYAKLLRIAGAEIRAHEPGAEILPGGMFGTPQTPVSFDAWTFMKKLLEQPGARRYVDAAAVHPYSPDLRGIRYQMNKMRHVLDKAGMQKTPIDVTELGWSSGKSDRFFFFKGPYGQKQMLKSSFKLLLQGRKRWRLERIIWFSWRDVEKDQVPAGCTYCSRFGLLRSDLDPKGSYTQYKRYALGKYKVKPKSLHKHKRHHHHKRKHRRKRR